jgi:hypothetical protein
MRVLALVLLLVGCSSAPRIVRLDTGQGTPRLHTPRSSQEAVKLSRGELVQALSQVARDVRPSPNPLRHARRLMFDSPWQEEVYLQWTGRRLVLEPRSGEGTHALSEPDELTRSYERWCAHTRRAQDCLSLLKDEPVLNADGRYTLALEFALGAVWNETMTAFADMADPDAVRATVVSAMAMYMMLWVLPEPLSKGLAAALTASLIAYLGVDTVWAMTQGWIRRSPS